MAARESDNQADVVARARARIARGELECRTHPEILERVIEGLLAELSACPIGDGNRYRDLIARYLPTCLAGLIDTTLIRKEFPASSGRVDIVMPVRTEALWQYALWEDYARRYHLKSIIVEAKNSRDGPTIRDVQQTRGYLDAARLGSFGLLVSRKECDRGTLRYLGDIARADKALILPLSDADLGTLAREVLSRGRNGTMEFVRRRETLLLLGTDRGESVWR